MKPDNPKPPNSRPLPPICRQCGKPLTKKGYCTDCSVRFLYDLSKWLERIEEEKQKLFSLSRLGFALRDARRFLPGFDMTPIEQAIEAAESRPVRAVQADNKEKSNAA